MKLRLLPEALARIEAGREWWLANRGKAPHLFDEELADALARITTSPRSGPRVSLRVGRSVHRILMPRTGFHVYYDVHEAQVDVLTIWGAARGDRPSL